MRPLPLKWRVSLLVGGTILVGMTFIALTAYVEMKESLTEGTDRTLGAMASSVTALLADAADDAASEGDVQGIVGTSTGGHGSAYRLWFDGSAGDLLTSPAHADLLGAAALAQQEQPLVGQRLYFNVGQRGDEHRAVWVRSDVRGRTANIAIAISSHPAYDALDDFQSRLLYTAGTIVLITIAATTLLVGVGLRPIGRTAQALSAVSDRNVGEPRIEVGGTPQELEPFVQALTDMLARLARALDQQKRFVSDASHELRTPLAVARSTIEAARVKDRTREGYRQALDEVREDLDRMGALIEDLLVMARLDETPGVREAEVFDLADLVEEMAGPFEAYAARQGGRLATDLRHVSVRGDRAQVRRLLSNLMDNALRHGPEGGTVTVSVAVPQAGQAEVRVHDEGGRIPAEALPRLFDRFCRVDQSRARATGGAGLGLSIAREIALRHGGDISVTSTPQDGTCFTARLPAA